MSRAEETARLNTLWAAAVVEELVRGGVTEFVIAPGSRSTPLVAAVAANGGARSVVLSDERGGAFYALGWGRATGRAAALVTTSGSAPGHALPAVLEAEADEVPLMVLSADRPPEARESGANQTLDQVRLFGGHVRWAHDFAAPSADVGLAAVVGLVGHGVRRTLDPAGPVHLNFMFRKPLEPMAGVTPDATLWPRAGAPRCRGRVPVRGLAGGEREELAEIVAGAERGVLVVGGLRDAAERAAAVTLAERLGWPVWADLGSGLRLGGRAPVVPLFEALLGDAAWRREHAPDVVIQVGGRVVSGRLETWLAEAQPREHVRVRGGAARDDVAQTVTWRLGADLATVAEALVPQPQDARVGAYRARSAALEAAFARDEGSGGERAEARLARALSQALPEGGGLFVGNSMPVRDWDRWAASDGPAVTVGLNRGASGIDGLIATAAGFARGLDRETVAVIGDQSLLHDVGSLAILAQARPPVTVVVVNNGGGHIFDHLPIAEHGDLLGRYFTAPSAWSVQEACAAFGVPHAAFATADALAEALAPRGAGPRVLEWRAPR